MQKITKLDVAEQILDMLTDGKTGRPAIQPEWQKQAVGYLHECSRLFPETHERKQIFYNFCSLVTSLSSNNDSDGVAVAFKLLYADKEEYRSLCRTYILERMRDFFTNPHTSPGEEDRFKKAVFKLNPPFELSADDVRQLIVHVRGLPETERDMLLDMRRLAFLLEQVQGLETGTLRKPLEEAAELFGSKGVTLAFDLLQLVSWEYGFKNLILMRVSDSCIDLLFSNITDKELNDKPADVVRGHRQVALSLLEVGEDDPDEYDETFRGYVISGLRLCCSRLDVGNDRKWLAEVLKALFPYDAEQQKLLKFMEVIAGLKRIDSDRWEGAVLNIASGTDPEAIAIDYMYDTWVQIALSGGPGQEPQLTSEDAAGTSALLETEEDIELLAREGKRLILNSGESFFQGSAQRIKAELDSDSSLVEHYAWYRRRLLWLSWFFPENDSRRQLVLELIKYRVIQNDRLDHYAQHVSTCLALFSIPGAESSLRTARCRDAAQKIRSLHETDSMGSPAKSDKGIDQAVKENFQIVRETVLPLIEEIMQ